MGLGPRSILPEASTPGFLFFLTVFIKTAIAKRFPEALKVSVESQQAGGSTRGVAPVISTTEVPPSVLVPLGPDGREEDGHRPPSDVAEIIKAAHNKRLLRKAEHAQKQDPSLQEHVRPPPSLIPF